VAEAIWKSSKGDVAVSSLNTVHIKNAISKVERELTESVVTDRAGKETILAALRAEYATRSDA